MTYRPYAGIGSRETPAEVCSLMTEIGQELGIHGFTLRSGHAEGADKAFEKGYDLMPDGLEIFLPWKGFNGSASPYYDWPDSTTAEHAMWLAAQVHPAWSRCSQGARKMHARNGAQILGWRLQHPSLFVVCWTPGGRLQGGTAQALRLADRYHIPIFNLGLPDQDKVLNDLSRFAQTLLPA